MANAHAMAHAATGMRGFHAVAIATEEWGRPSTLIASLSRAGKRKTSLIRLQQTPIGVPIGLVCYLFVPSELRRYGFIEC